MPFLPIQTPSLKNPTGLLPPLVYTDKTPAICLGLPGIQRRRSLESTLERALAGTQRRY